MGAEGVNTFLSSLNPDLPNFMFFPLLPHESSRILFLLIQILRGCCQGIFFQKVNFSKMPLMLAHSSDYFK